MGGHTLGHYLLWIIAGAGLAVCILAWLRGGTAERWGATMVACVWALGVVVEDTVNQGVASIWLVSTPILAMDFALSFGLLVLALRYGSLWVGAAMLAQSAQLGLHAFFIADEGQHRQAFAIGSNLCSELLILTLLIGTVTSWRRRIVQRQEQRGALPA